MEQYDLEHRLSIFVKEEVLVWSAMTKPVDGRGGLRELVLQNVDSVVRKAKVMACKMERDKVRLRFHQIEIQWRADSFRVCIAAKRIYACEPGGARAVDPGDEPAEPGAVRAQLAPLAMRVVVFRSSFTVLFM